MKLNESIKPQDIVILSKILLWQKKGDQAWKIATLAYELGISHAEISDSMSRTSFAGLFIKERRSVVVSNYFEFIIHGVKYAYPVRPGIISRGIPTAHSSPFLKQKIISNEPFSYVWSHPLGTVKGQSLLPLYKTVPEAVLKDNDLYELLALIDVIRVGRAREQKIAEQILKERIL